MATKKTTPVQPAKQDAPVNPAAENISAPTTEQQADVSASAAEQSAATPSTDPVTVDSNAVETQTSPAGERLGALHVAARVDGFRRCGRAWPSAGVTVPKSEFSDQQIEILVNEPALVVTEVFE